MKKLGINVFPIEIIHIIINDNQREKELIRISSDIKEDPIDSLWKVRKSHKLSEKSGENVYKMSNSPRGYCLIINNINFESEAFPKRNGSEIESQRLKQVFNELDFNVNEFNDIRAEEIVCQLKRFCKKDQRNSDAFIVFVLSHGDQNGFYGTDGELVKYETVLKQYNNQNCPQLIGKPKIFFFNCCRGGENSL